MCRVTWKYYAILYKGVEHPQTLVSGGPGTNAPWTPRDDCIDLHN